MASRLTTFIVVLIVTGTLVAGLIVGAQREDRTGRSISSSPTDRCSRAAGGALAEAVAVRGNKILKRRHRTATSSAFVGARPSASTRTAPRSSPGFNDSHAHLISGGLALEQLDLLDATDARRDQGHDARLRHCECGPALGPRSRLVLRAIRDVAADAAAARLARARSTRVPHRLRRPHGVGELTRARGRRHHATDEGSEARPIVKRRRAPANRPAR